MPEKNSQETKEGRRPERRPVSMKKEDRKCQTRHWSKEGFTLLEIMIALSILAVGLVAVLELFAGSLRLTGKASHRTQAVIHAQNVMDGFFAPISWKMGRTAGAAGWVFLAGTGAGNLSG